MSTKHDLTYTDGYDDEIRDRYIETEIVYDISDGYWETAGLIQRHWTPGEINIKSVRVKFIEFFEPHFGNMIARVERRTVQRDALVTLDRHELARAELDVENFGPLADELAEHAA